MVRKVFLTIIALIKITEQAVLHEYKFKVWINHDIVSTYGGHGTEYAKRSRIESLIKQQWINVNNYYNRQNGFQSRFNFIPYKFDYFQDNSNETHMDNIDFKVPLPEDDCDYRIIYAHSTYNHHIHSDYFNRSIRFSVNPESEWNETIWDLYSTRILSHELGHSRGAYDLYSVNVNGNQNQIYPGVNYNYPVGSIMNYLYDLNTNFDKLSMHIMNQYAGRIVTPKLSSEMFWSLFPSTFGVQVKDMSNNPIRNVLVTFYGVRWLAQSININDRFERKTDNHGRITFNGSEINNNPYQRNGATTLSTFSNFLVVIYNEGNGLLNWLPVFLVQTAKIENKTEYYVDFQFNMKPKIEFVHPKNHTFNFTVPQFINSFDLSCHVHYALIAKMNVSVHAWDIDGHIAKVEFYSSNQLLGIVSTEPYVFEWFISKNGTYDITAIAYDNLNGVSESKTIMINVLSTESGMDTAMNMIEDDECLV